MAAMQKKIGLFLLVLAHVVLEGRAKNHPYEQIATANTIKSAHLKGWYPTQKKALERQVQYFLNQANTWFKVREGHIRAIMVPHAGLLYSGLASATAYAAIQKQAHNFRKIIILAPMHHHNFQGIITTSMYKKFEVPNGELNIDESWVREFYKRCIKRKLPCYQNDIAFSQEHSIEIQLPFLAHVLPKAKIIPILVGGLNAQEVQALAEAINDTGIKNALILASTDLMHHGAQYNYQPWNEEINRKIWDLDTLALNAVLNLELEDFAQLTDDQQIAGISANWCGRYAVRLMLAILQKSQPKTPCDTQLAARYDSMQIGRIDQENLNQLAIASLCGLNEQEISNQDQRVGYGSIVFYKKPVAKIHPSSPNFIPTLSDCEKWYLLDLVRQKIQQGVLQWTSVGGETLFDQPTQPIFNITLPEVLRAPDFKHSYGTFVTILDADHNLRGCIGRSLSNKSLTAQVEETAEDAALRDARFHPVEIEELPRLSYELSILSSLRRQPNYNRIMLGRDGIKITDSFSGKTALFLPEVPIQQGWSLEQTLDALCEKAGLETNFWRIHPYTTYHVFSTVKIKV